MKVCNCTLAGTEACNNCTNNPDYIYYTGEDKSTIFITDSITHIGGYPIAQYGCSECEASLNKYDNYCHNCGVKINWDMMQEE